jgi:DNA-binding GntR family transcriptional regulator
MAAQDDQNGAHAYRLLGQTLRQEFHRNATIRLLLPLDRLPSNELTMTHELIANMLGVRREGVTAAVSKLQRVGVIDRSRGHITVLDRPALERLSCECYAVVKKETDRLLTYPRGEPGFTGSTA